VGLVQSAGYTLLSFFGSLLKIVAIGAFFVATGPFGLTVGSTLASALRIGGIVLGYLGALVDRPRLLNERQSLQVRTTLEPGTPLPVIYGRAKVGVIIADWFIQPVNNFKELYIVTALAHGSRDGLGVAGIDEIWVNQRKAIDSTGARFYPYKIIALSYKYFLGSTTQNIGATKFFTDGSGVGIQEPGNVSGSGWNLTTDTGKGVVGIGFVLVNVDSATFSETARAISSNSVANPTVVTTSTAHGFLTGDTVRIANHTGSTPAINGDWVCTVISSTTFSVPANVTVGGGASGSVKRFSEGPVYGGGPPGLAAIVRGNRIYDSRTDIWTAGADNPPMCIRDYLLAPIYGCGFVGTMIHEQSFKDAADYCDTLVRHQVGTAVTISNSDAATERVNTSTAHGWSTGQLVRIAGHSGSTPALDGDHVITVTSSTSFTLNDVANITVGGTGGTVIKLVEIKRHTCNGVVDTSRPTAENLQELLSSCRGNLVWEQGQFKLTIRSELIANPTVTLSPANIIGQWEFRNAGLEDKWNSVTATYIEPANGEFKTQEVQWPLVGTTNNYLASDGAFTNNLQLSLPFTNDQLMAQMIAQITLNEARLGISCSVRCTEEALALSVGDKVKVTHPTPGWTDKVFWVTALQLLPDTTVSVSLQEYDTTAYSLSTMEDRRSFPATTLDSIFTVPPPGAVSSVALAGGGLKITWVGAVYGLIDFYEVQTRITSSGEDWVTIERVREQGVLQAIAPLARPGQTWDARVRVVNVVGWPSEWSDAPQLAIPVPPPVTPGVGVATWQGYAPTITIIPTSPDITAASSTDEGGGDFCTGGGSAWTLSVHWTVTGSNDTDFETVIYVASDSAGVTFVQLVTGLTTSSSLYVHDTGVNGYTFGTPITYYRKYKVAIRRKSDSVDTDFELTSQRTKSVDPSGTCA
jgi:putative tail protein